MSKIDLKKPIDKKELIKKQKQQDKIKRNIRKIKREEIRIKYPLKNKTKQTKKAIASKIHLKKKQVTPKHESIFIGNTNSKTMVKD